MKYLRKMCRVLRDRATVRVTLLQNYLNPYINQLRYKVLRCRKYLSKLLYDQERPQCIRWSQVPNRLQVALKEISSQQFEGRKDLYNCRSEYTSTYIPMDGKRRRYYKTRVNDEVKANCPYIDFDGMHKAKHEYKMGDDMIQDLFDFLHDQECYYE